MPSAITSSDSQTLIHDDNAGKKSPSPRFPSSLNDVGTSRSVVRRKGVQKSNSGGQLQSSTTRQHRGTERSRSASSSKSLTPTPIRQRVSMLSPRPSFDASLASTKSPLSDNESIGSYSLKNEYKTQQKKKDPKTTNSVRSQISRINRECDTLESHKRGSALKRTGSRSSEVLEHTASLHSRESPHLRGRKKPSSVPAIEDSLTIVSSPSFNSSPASVRAKSKKQFSTPKAEDTADDSSFRGERRKARSTSRVSSTKQRSSSRKRLSDSEKGKRHSRRSRTPSSKKEHEKPNSDRSLDRRRGPVSEDEIYQLLSLTNDPPLVAGDDDTQQRAMRSKKQSKSLPESLEPNNQEKRSSKKYPSNAQRRRSNSSSAFESNTKVSRRFSNEAETKIEKKEKRTRNPPRRTRSNNIGVDSNALHNFFQHDVTGTRRKKPAGSTRSVLSSSKSVSLSGSRSIATTRSSKSRRRRKDIYGGKSLKSKSPEISLREYHRDEKKDVELSAHRRNFDDSDLIMESDYDSSSSDDDRSVDLDLATARNNFAQQNLNEKLQLHLNKTDELLYSVFPKHIADALLNGQKVAPENHELVTIFFSDIVGFTDISAKLDPLKISELLDRLYNSFDSLSDYHDVFKVETIGDAYMAVTNLEKEQPDHCKRITEFAIDAIRVANQTLVDEDNPSMGFVNIRVGFHSGSVVSNVVGSRNPRYCLFGDTVNTASRMESNSEKNRINCSEISAALLRKQCPRMRIFPRGSIDVKGKGEMKTFWIHTEGSVSTRDRNKGTIRNFMNAVRKR